MDAGFILRGGIWDRFLPKVPGLGRNERKARIDLVTCMQNWGNYDKCSNDNYSLGIIYN